MKTYNYEDLIIISKEELFLKDLVFYLEDKVKGMLTSNYASEVGEISTGNLIKIESLLKDFSNYLLDSLHNQSFTKDSLSHIFNTYANIYMFNKYNMKTNVRVEGWLLINYINYFINTIEICRVKLR